MASIEKSNETVNALYRDKRIVDFPETDHLLFQVPAFHLQSRSSEYNVTFLCNEGRNMTNVSFQDVVLKLNPLSVKITRKCFFDFSSNCDNQSPYLDIEELETSSFCELETFHIHVLRSSSLSFRISGMLNIIKDGTDYMWHTVKSIASPYGNMVYEAIVEKLFLNYTYLIYFISL
eukprot:jgi/Galph1/3586/GphlegSOOS_G2312.1